MRDKFRDDNFWDQWATLSLLRRLESLLHRDYCLNTTAVHELHHKIDHSLIVENSMVLDLLAIETFSGQRVGEGSTYELGQCLVEHLEFIVELMPLVFVVKVDDLHCYTSSGYEWVLP